VTTVGLDLPPAPVPRGSYAPSCTAGGWVVISGQTCRVDGIAMAGACDAATDLALPQEAARVAMRNTLAALKAACGGDLGRVRQVLQLRGFVRSTADFCRHTAVLDAASELLRCVFPAQALPARTAVGVSSLPDGAWVELELLALVD